MKGPSLQKTTIISFALHATFFLLSMIVLRNSNRMLMPSPYIVTLVSGGGSIEAPGAGSQTTQPAASKQTIESASAVEKGSADVKADQKRLEESIAALKAKKKIERIVGLRKAVLSIKAGDQTAGAIKTSGRSAQRGKGGPGGELTYADKIRTEIHRQWFYPDTSEKNLEAVISVKIMKDGQITVQEMEKKSGNRLFDRLALKAIEKASPVTPPPYDGVEFGIRFTP